MWIQGARLKSCPVLEHPPTNMSWVKGILCTPTVCEMRFHRSLKALPCASPLASPVPDHTVQNHLMQALSGPKLQMIRKRGRLQTHVVPEWQWHCKTGWLSHPTFSLPAVVHKKVGQNFVPQHASAKMVLRCRADLLGTSAANSYCRGECHMA